MCVLVSLCVCVCMSMCLWFCLCYGLRVCAFLCVCACFFGGCGLLLCLFLSCCCVSAPAKPSDVDVLVDRTSQQITASWSLNSTCAATQFNVTVYKANDQVVTRQATSDQTTQFAPLSERCVDLWVGVTASNAYGTSTESDRKGFRLDGGKRSHSHSHSHRHSHCRCHCHSYCQSHCQCGSGLLGELV